MPHQRRKVQYAALLWYPGRQGLRSIVISLVAPRLGVADVISFFVDFCTALQGAPTASAFGAIFTVEHGTEPETRLEQRAAAQVPKRPTPPQGGGIGPAADIAAEATSGRAVAESSMPPSPAATSSSVPMFDVPAMTQAQNDRPAFQFTGCRSAATRPWAAVAAQPTSRSTSTGSALLSAATRPAGQAARTLSQCCGSKAQHMQTMR